MSTAPEEMNGPALVAGFDDAPDRGPTHTTKWGRYAGRDVLPFWVADMEFPAPAPILDALHARIDHGILGYTLIPDSLRDAAVEFLARKYDWHVRQDWLVFLPGVVPGLNVSLRAVSEAGTSTLIASPIYYPFLDAPRHSERRKLETPLLRDGDRWVMDFEDVERTIEGDTRSFMLCNPHNPTGRAYTREELLAIAGFCERHDLVIISDEIHAELVLDEDARHIPIASLAPEIAARTITLIAPTKTFNIPGIACACAVIPDARLRAAFVEARAGMLPGIGPLGFAAAEAAWTHCEPWRQQLLAVLRRNRDAVQAWVAATPGLETTHVEATCLAWIDTAGRELPNPQAFFERHGVGPSPGSQFAGARGAGASYIRFNFGCPWPMLQEGLARMTRALA